MYIRAATQTSLAELQRARMVGTAHTHFAHRVAETRYARVVRCLSVTVCLRCRIVCVSVCVAGCVSVWLCVCGCAALPRRQGATIAQVSAAVSAECREHASHN